MCSSEKENRIIIHVDFVAALVKIFSLESFFILRLEGWKCCNDEKSNIIVAVYRKMNDWDGGGMRFI